jgi:hypothetical protein
LFLEKFDDGRAILTGYDVFRLNPYGFAPQPGLQMADSHQREWLALAGEDDDRAWPIICKVSVRGKGRRKCAFPIAIDNEGLYTGLIHEIARQLPAAISFCFRVRWNRDPRFDLSMRCISP